MKLFDIFNGKKKRRRRSSEEESQHRDKKRHRPKETVEVIKVTAATYQSKQFLAVLVSWFCRPCHYLEVVG